MLPGLSVLTLHGDHIALYLRESSQPRGKATAKLLLFPNMRDSMQWLMRAPAPISLRRLTRSHSNPVAPKGQRQSAQIRQSFSAITYMTNRLDHRQPSHSEEKVRCEMNISSCLSIIACVTSAITSRLGRQAIASLEVFLERALRLAY